VDRRRPDSRHQQAPYRLYNIGNNQPVELMHYIEVLEEGLRRFVEWYREWKGR
jgi:UDP-glucuronate 4-epimerase